MENKKITLMLILFLKECIHWKRMGKLWNEVGTDIGARFIAYPIIVILITIAHYCFAFMHTMFECSLAIFMNAQFKMNLINLHKKTIHTLSLI